MRPIRDAQGPICTHSQYRGSTSKKSIIYFLQANSRDADLVNISIEKVNSAAHLTKKLRVALGNLNQAELARRLLISRNYVSQIEAGLKKPSERLLAAIKLMLNDATLPVADNDPSDTLAVGEESAPYEVVETLEAEIQRIFRETLRGTGNDVGRLGWLREELRSVYARAPWLRPVAGTLPPRQGTAPQSHGA